MNKGMENQNILQAFREALKTCGLYDLGFKGYEFTWRSKRGGDESVEERLDRFYANVDWSILFPKAEVFHLNDKTF